MNTGRMSKTVNVRSGILLCRAKVAGLEHDGGPNRPHPDALTPHHPSDPHPATPCPGEKGRLTRRREGQSGMKSFFIMALWIPIRSYRRALLKDFG